LSGILIIGLIAIFVVLGIYAPRIKGAIGESKVALRLKLLNKKEFKVINDVLLKSGDRSSQIDHIVVSIYGIFVIETKNYGGWIHGHENSEYWVQTYYKNKTRFKNPVIQNKGHIITLKKVLQEYKHVVYYPIVVFSGKAKLKNVHSEVPVIYSRQLLKTIKNTTGTKNLTIEEVNEITEKLNKSHVHGRGARREHILKSRKNIYEQKRKKNSSICPRCGGNLVVRNSQYGKFQGCSNFPKCRYTTK
jgi:hypothetical protein